MFQSLKEEKAAVIIDQLRLFENSQIENGHNLNRLKGLVQLSAQGRPYMTP